MLKKFEQSASQIPQFVLYIVFISIKDMYPWLALLHIIFKEYDMIPDAVQKGL